MCKLRQVLPVDVVTTALFRFSMAYVPSPGRQSCGEKSIKQPELSPTIADIQNGRTLFWLELWFDLLRVSQSRRGLNPEELYLSDRLSQCRLREKKPPGKPKRPTDRLLPTFAAKTTEESGADGRAAEEKSWENGMHGTESNLQRPKFLL